MKKYIVTLSDNETFTVSQKTLLDAQKAAHKNAAKLQRTVKTVMEVSEDISINN